MQGFNLDLELPSRNDCLIILCEMIIEAFVPKIKKSGILREKNEDTTRLFFLIHWQRFQIWN